MSVRKFLDDTGTRSVIDTVKDWFNALGEILGAASRKDVDTTITASTVSTDLPTSAAVAGLVKTIPHTDYGTCATAEGTAAKEVTLSGYELVTGGEITVLFTYAVPANATLNVTSKGAKDIWYQGAAITAGVIQAGDLVTFIYDGTRYRISSIDQSGGGGGSALTYDSGYIAVNYDVVS